MSQEKIDAYCCNHSVTLKGRMLGWCVDSDNIIGTITMKLAKGVTEKEMKKMPLFEGIYLKFV